MSERRGHRKLRLCSKKNYERKRAASKHRALLNSSDLSDGSKLPHVTDLSVVPHDATSSEHQQKCVEKNQEEISFNISVPLSFFTDEAVSSLDALDRRLQKVDSTLEGMFSYYLYSCLYVCVCGSTLNLQNGCMLMKMEKCLSVSLVSAVRD